MNYFEKYKRLVFLITKNEELSKEIAELLIESDTNPSAFFERYSGVYFTNRNINEPGDEDQTLLYLIDRLDMEGFAMELDYKPDVEEINEAIEELSKGKIKDLLDLDEDDFDSMFELIDEAFEALEEHDLAVFTFSIDSDSYPIALVAAEDYDEITAIYEEIF